MNITWLGHSSFLLEFNNGVKLLQDPFDETVGYPLYSGYPDIITVSHEHFDHNYTKPFLKDSPTIVNTCGSFKVKDISIKGIASFHDNMLGEKRGPNIIYVIEAEGLRICHLGDLGHTLKEDVINEIGAIDILFVPVGGNYTLDGKEAAQVAKSIGSTYIIPMHYKTPYINFPISGAEDFITCMENGKREPSNTINLCAERNSPQNNNNVIILSLNNHNNEMGCCTISDTK